MLLLELLRIQLWTILYFSFQLKITSSNEKCPLFSLQHSERSVFSQNGEDGVIATLFSIIGSQSRSYVEFGVENGEQCNTRFLREAFGFKGLLMDGGYENRDINLYKEFITVDNISHLFQKYNVSSEFDLLSIDLDMFDFWILAEVLKTYRPRLIVAEVNPTLGHNIHDSASQSDRVYMQSFRDLNSMPLTVAHPHTLDQTTWDGTRYSGANPLAFKTLANEFGYEMVYCESCGVNCFFVLRSQIPKSCPTHFPMPTIFYPCYGTVVDSNSIIGHISDRRQRNPVLLSQSLVRQIVQGLVFKEDPSKNVLDLSKYTVNNNSYSELCLLSSSSSACLLDQTCQLPDDADAQSQMNYFNSFFEVYSTVAEPRLQSMSMKGYEWTCFLLRHLKNSTVCQDIAKYHLERAYYLLQSNRISEAEASVMEGLKFDLHNFQLICIQSYFDISKRLSSQVYSLAFFDVSRQEEILTVVVGAGVCDDIVYRSRHHALLFGYDFELYQKVMSLSVKENSGYMKFHIGNHGPIYQYQNSSHYILESVPFPIKQYIFKETLQQIDRTCHNRMKFSSTLTILPPFVNVEKVTKDMCFAFGDEQCALQKWFHGVNVKLLQAVGCDDAQHMLSVTCAKKLHSLAQGFVHISNKSNAKFWSSIAQEIYQKRISSSEPEIILADYILGVTLPFFKEPLGNVHARVLLFNPLCSVRYVQSALSISFQDALGIFEFLLISTIESTKSIDSVTFVDVMGPELPSEMFGLLEHKMQCKLWLKEFHSVPTVESLVPSWIGLCIDSLLRNGESGPCRP